MKAQCVIHLGWVKEECAAEAGATPVLRTSRVGSAALVAPASASACTKVDRIRYLIGQGRVAIRYRVLHVLGRNRYFIQSVPVSA